MVDALEVTACPHLELELARFRGMVENSAEMVLLIGADRIIRYASTAAAQILGAPISEIVGTSGVDWVHPEDRRRINAALVQLIADPATVLRGLEFRVLRRDGTSRWIEAAGSNHLADPAIAAVVTNSHDVTDRKLAEQALREHRHVLEQGEALVHAGSWVAGLDPDAPIAWSAECARIFGGDPAHPPTRAGFMARVHPDDVPRIFAAIERCTREGLPYDEESRIVRYDGEVRWTHGRSVVQLAPDGKPLGAIGIVQDITAQRAVTEQLRASEDRYRRIVETTSEGVTIHDADDRVVFANGRACTMLGHPPGGLIGLRVPELVHPDSRAVAQRRLALRRDGVGDTYQLRLLRPDERELWAQISANPIFDADGRYEGTLSLITDITAQRRAAAQAKLLAAIVESSDDAITGLDLDGVVTSWNAAAERLLGYTADEMIGRPIFAIVPPERTAEEIDVLARIARGETVSHVQTVRLRKDGTLLDISISVAPIRAADGTIVGASKIGRDLTALRKAEADLRETALQLQQSQKMEAIGALAGGVAHDFNNLLLIMMSYTSMLLGDVAANDPMREDLEEIAHAVDRASALTRQLLAFSRRQILQPRVIDLNETVTGLQKMLRRLLREDIETSLLLAPKLANVHADPGQIEQVVMNLVVNARDAMPDGGRVTIETMDVELDDEYAARHVGVAPGPYVMLAVTDTGVGMTREIQAKAFEPFFTTKGLGAGTGLGLATVYGIVKQSGGNVLVYSEPGHGAAFKVYLPRSDRAREHTAAASSSQSLRGSETVLLVEDEDGVRAALRTILRRNGYAVLEASNGGEALLVCEQHPGRIDLLLTDVVMPRMNGRVLAQRLVAMLPTLRVLYDSASTENTVIHHGVLDTGIAFVQKPVSPDALLRKVREVLDTSAA